MKASSGITAAMLKTGEPHAEQKFRSVSSPWSSPVVAYGGDRAALDVQRGAGHAHDHGERVARLALAVRAVADPLNHRLGVGAVGHAATQTATGDGPGDISHARVTLHETPERWRNHPSV